MNNSSEYVNCVQIVLLIENDNEKHDLEIK